MEKIPDIDYRAVFEQTSNPYLLLASDIPVYTIIDVSDSYLKATMTKKEEILGRSIFDVFPDNPDDPDATGVVNLRESLNRVVISRKADSIAVQKYDLRRPDGTFEERWWTTANSPILSSDGTLKYIVHKVEDITAFTKHLKIKKSELKSSCKAEREADKTEAEVFIQGQKLQEVNRRLRLARQTITTLYNNVVELKKTKENRAQLAELVEQVNDGIFSTNLDGIIVSINSGVKKIYGYTEEEIKGKPITVLVPPERVDESVKILHKIRNGEAVRDLETVRMRKDGSLVSVQISVNPLRDLNGKIVGTASIVHDITERKRSEQALRESEERFRTLADNILQFAWTADTGGEILWVNKRWYDYSGTVLEDVRKWGWVKFLHPDQIDSVVPKIHRSIDTGEFWEDNLRLRGKDGNYRWFLSRAVPKRNELGKIVQWFGTATDITEIRELEEKLRRERELFETIVENVPVIITLYDPEKMKVEFNKAFYEITGWTEEDLADHDAMELSYPDADYRETVFEYMRSLSPGFRDFIMRGKNGVTIESAWANVRIPDGRQIGIGIDIRERKRAEKEISIMAERFKRITLSNIIGCTITKFDGSITFTNDYFLNTIKYSREDFEKGLINWRKITPPKFSSLDEKAVRELRKTGTAETFEKQYIRKDGSRVWVLLSITLLPAPEEEAFVFVSDVSMRKHALEEVENSRAEIEAILNSLPDGYIVYGKNGSLRRFNDLGLKIMGIPPEMLKSSYDELFDRIHPFTSGERIFPKEHLPSYRALHGETVHGVVMKTSNQNGDFWVSVSASPISTDGKVLGAIVEYSDITELHDLQEKLTDERNFVNAILQTSGALILVIDTRARILRFNRACEYLTGYKESEVKNKSLLDLFIPENERAQVEKVLRRLFDGEPLVEHESYWVIRSGEKRFIRFRKTVLLNENGSVSMIIATGIDISDRKRLEEQLNKHAEELANANRELESFSYSVAHDLRNPLKIIGGFTDLLIDECRETLNEECGSYVGRIQSNVRRMNSIIDDMLALAKISRHEINIVDLDLSDMVVKAVNELSVANPDRQVDVKIEEGLKVRADDRLMSVALGNLLSNAWKYTSKVEHAQIEFGSFIKDNQRIFYVKDNGAGFDMALADKLFKPFQRLHGETEFSGTGVGLAIVERAIARHGGKIWAEGEAGKGATFYFTLK